MKINHNNLDRWNQILKPIKNIFLELAAKYDVTFPYRYYAAKSVFFQKNIHLKILFIILISTLVRIYFLILHMKML